MTCRSAAPLEVYTVLASIQPTITGRGTHVHVPIPVHHVPHILCADHCRSLLLQGNSLLAFSCCPCALHRVFPDRGCRSHVTFFGRCLHCVSNVHVCMNPAHRVQALRHPQATSKPIAYTAAGLHCNSGRHRESTFGLVIAMVALGLCASRWTPACIKSESNQKTVLEGGHGRNVLCYDLLQFRSNHSLWYSDAAKSRPCGWLSKHH
jgi:hypothetical protein